MHVRAQTCTRVCMCMHMVCVRVCPRPCSGGGRSPHPAPNPQIPGLLPTLWGRPPLAPPGPSSYLVPQLLSSDSVCPHLAPLSWPPPGGSYLRSFLGLPQQLAQAWQPPDTFSPVLRPEVWDWGASAGPSSGPLLAAGAASILGGHGSLLHLQPLPLSSSLPPVCVITRHLHCVCVKIPSS